MHVSDLNLAGLATLSLLGFVFPGIGFIHRRAIRAAARRKAQAEKRALALLVLEEADAMLHRTRQTADPGEPARRR
jgi:hypothetical protein